MPTQTTPGDKREGGPPQLEPDVQAPPTGSAPDATSRFDLIGQRPYERFQIRGGEHGRDEEDWLEAERELEAEE